LPENVSDRNRADRIAAKFKERKMGKSRIMEGGKPALYHHPATLIGNWSEERQVLPPPVAQRPSETKEKFAPLAKSCYRKDYESIYKHKIRFYIWENSSLLY
jgi:hypothetical protein